MTGLDLVTLAAGPVVKDDDLVAFALVNHSGLDRSAADGGLAHLDVAAIRYQQHIVKDDLIADLLRQCFDANCLADAGAKLLSADLKDCIHDDTPDVTRLRRARRFSLT